MKSLKDADSFAIHDLDHKMYLEINAQPTLSPISDDKEPSRLWKIAEGGSLKIDDYCFGHLQERSESNVISIVVSGVGAYLQHEIILYVVGLPLAFPDLK